MASLLTPLVNASTPAETWSDITHDPVISNGATLTSGEFKKLRDKSISVWGDMECVDRTLPFGPAETDGSYQGCWYDTSIGLIEKSGVFIQLKDQPYVGLVNETNSQLFPTPNRDVFIEVTPSRNSTEYTLQFRTVNDAAMVPSAVQPGYPVFYAWKGPATARYLDSAGASRIVSGNTVYIQVTYSNNHRWMLLWDTRGFVTRVDLQTFATRDFAIEDGVAAEGRDWATMAITDDGRFIAVDVLGKQQHMLDVDTCLPATDLAHIDDDGHLEACSYRELDFYLKSFLGLPLGAAFAGLPRYISDDLLSYYTLDDNGEGDYDQYYFRAPNTSHTNYIALGDSFASGEGAKNTDFYRETDLHDQNMCHLSTESYPFKIGQELHLESTHSVACSGAKSMNVVGGSNLSNQYPLLPSSANELSDWLPGYRRQIDFVKDNKPNIITISMIGNDIGFKYIIQRCLGADTCYASYEDRLELVRLINNQFDKLVDMYTQIKQATVPDARIYVVGYPYLIREGGDCGENVHLNMDETFFANTLEGYLNNVIELAAQKAGVSFVDVRNALIGHRLCEDEQLTHDDYPQQKAVNGITFGQDTLTVPFTDKQILSNGSFHPNELGHRMMADAIKSATYNFTLAMPRAISTMRAPVDNDAIILLDTPRSGREIYPVNYDDDLSNDVVFVNGKYGELMAPHPLLPRLQPHSWVQFWLHSNPIDLGKFSVDGNGEFSGQLIIPKSTSVGFHTLSAIATTPDGVVREFRKTVYVAFSPDDYDGNGIPNSQEPCLIFNVDSNGLRGPNYDCSMTFLSQRDDNDTPAMTSEASKLSPGDFTLVRTLVDSSQSTDESNETSNSTLSQKSPGRIDSAKQKTHKANYKWVWTGAGIGFLLVCILTFYLCLRYADANERKA